MLAKYCIGEIGTSSGDDSLKSSVVEYENAANEDFYTTLKQRVEAYFKRQKVVQCTRIVFLVLVLLNG